MITSAGRTAALVVLRGGGRCRSPWASLAEALQKRLGVGSCCPLAWGMDPPPGRSPPVPAPGPVIPAGALKLPAPHVAAPPAHAGPPPPPDVGEGAGEAGL